MKNGFKKIVSMVLVLCTVFTTGVIGSMVSASAVTEAIFDEENSYLTLEEYQSLDLDVYTATSLNYADMNKVDGAKLAGVEYGWSNPQVLAVLASAPYWSELNYGAGLAAPGSTSFTVSSSTTNSNSVGLNVELGISVTASATAEALGNGGETGATVKSAITAAESFQRENTIGTSQIFTAGAGDDHVVLMTIPVASFKYECINSKGETEYIVVNVQLDPVYGMATLDTYNTVAINHNHHETVSERMMPVIELDNIIDYYEAGDPATCISDASQIPTSLSVVYGDVNADEHCYLSDEATGENQIKGTVYTTDNYSSIGVGNTCMDQKISLSESQGQTFECGIMLGASIYKEVSVGFDIGIVDTSAALRGEISAEAGLSTSFTTISSTGFECTMSFASLPSSAITGVNSMGISTTPYSFNTKLAVWVPQSKGENVWCAPIFVLPIVKFDSSKTLPPELPDEFYVESVTETTAAFMFSTSYTHHTTRSPYKYQIMVKTAGNATDNYVLYEEIDASYYMYEITGLKPDTEYTFAIKSIAADGTESALSTPLTIKTASDQCPVITNQPKTDRFDEGDEPVFAVTVQGNADDYYYQWEKMCEDRYGYVWTPISGATQNTFNAAYFSNDGKVSDTNRTVLDETAYRCIVTDKATGVSVVSDTAVLYISDAILIESYTELKQIAYNISVGNTDYIYRDYILGCDIVFPEGEVWTVPFGTYEYPYQGDFDGRGHTIEGFAFYNPQCEYSGFFGCTKYATIKNLTIKDADITGGYCTGAFVGRTVNTYIDDCYVTGNTVVKGSYEVGGFVGDTGVNSYFTNCYAEGDIEGTDEKGYAGGFSGINYGSDIENCISCCTISAKGTKGGIAGFNLCRITNSFFDSSLFDGDVSGVSISANETNSKGMSTAEITKIIEKLNV